VARHRCLCTGYVIATYTQPSRTRKLAKKFSTIAAILEDPTIQKFVGWVKTKPPGFEDEAEERGRRR